MVVSSGDPEKIHPIGDFVLSLNHHKCPAVLRSRVCVARVNIHNLDVPNHRSAGYAATLRRIWLFPSTTTVLWDIVLLTLQPVRIVRIVRIAEVGVILSPNASIYS